MNENEGYHGMNEVNSVIVEQLKKAVYKMVIEKDHVSYVELCKIDGARGEFECVFPGRTSWVMWQGVSSELMSAINSLLNEDKIHYRGASLLTYLADGQMLNLPMIKKNREYKKPHWIPIVFRPGAAPKGKKRCTSK